MDDTAPDFYNLPSSFEIFEYDETSIEEFNPYELTYQEISITDEDINFQTGFRFELKSIKETPVELIGIVKKGETRGV